MVYLSACEMTKQIDVRAFIHKVSSGNRGVDPPGPMPNLAVKPLIAGGTTVCRIPLYLSLDRSRGAAERLFSAAAGVCVWKDVLGLGKLFKNYPRKTRGQLFGVV